MNRLRSSPISAVQLRDALGSGLDTLPDGELLDRFARYADHPAFEVLVRRHGPMVFGVCRRTLSNTADADDAFQAVFLVLVRKARSLRHSDRLGPWLYGVACRVAMKARSREGRRAAFRTEATDMIPDPTEPPEIPDWLPILDAELNALPPKYRDPLVLCELQGATRADAAKRLGVPEGTLSSRLARGRDLLRKRLLKRGTLLPAGGLAALFTASNVGRAVVPAALLLRTSELAKVSTGAAPAGAVPAGAARLTDEVLKGMFLTKLRLAGGALALLALVAIGVAAAAALPTDAPGAPPGGKMDPPAVPAMDRPKAAAPARPRPVEGPDQKVVQGYWKLEKLDLPKPKLAKPAEEAEYAAAYALLAKHMWLLVEGDVWWLATGYSASRHEVKLTPERNPKWIDAPTVSAKNVTHLGLRGIYRLPDADTLELCLGEGAQNVRPAEFVPDDDHVMMLIRFKRHALPEVPAARRAARQPLHGSWHPRGERSDEGPQSAVFTPNFAFLSDSQLSWAAYTYEVDVEKDPAWIDMTPVLGEHSLPTGGEKPLPICGVYAYRGPNDSALDLALGEGVKRVARPLEFVADKTNKVRVLNLTRAGDKLAAPVPKEKAGIGADGAIAPMPREKGGIGADT